MQLHFYFSRFDKSIKRVCSDVSNEKIKAS